MSTEISRNEKKRIYIVVKPLRIRANVERPVINTLIVISSDWLEHQ